MKKRGRVSSSHSKKQTTFLNYLHWDDISGVRPEFDCIGRCIFKGLVKQDIVTSLRQAAHCQSYSAIFNKGDTSRKRQVSTAPQQGQQVMEAIFEFLQTRALIATKWHDIKFGRHASFLCSYPGACQQTPHTDFEPVEFCNPIANLLETQIARPFAVLVALQDGTQLCFADAVEELLPIEMSAGDVVVFGGDVDHCGAQWTKKQGAVSMRTLGDPNNYRLFGYVPSHYRPEFLVPWIAREENLDKLKEVTQKDAVRLKLFDETDPDLDEFRNETFQKYLRYSTTFYEYSEEEYYKGIDSFPMRTHAKRRLPIAVPPATTGRCSHFAKVKAQFFLNETAAQSNLDQLRKHCKHCAEKPPKHRRREFDTEAFAGFVQLWSLQDKRKLVKLALQFSEEYRKQFPNSKQSFL